MERPRHPARSGARCVTQNDMHILAQDISSCNLSAATGQQTASSKQAACCTATKLDECNIEPVFACNICLVLRMSCLPAAGRVVVEEPFWREQFAASGGTAAMGAKLQGLQNFTIDSGELAKQRRALRPCTLLAHTVCL